MANLLAIDTSGSFCSVTLYQTHLAPDYVNDNQTLNPILSIASDALLSLHEPAVRTHTQRVLPMVQEVLKQRGLTPQHLDFIAYGCGPGSFTGIRIAAGIAQGLAFGLEVPLIPISTLQAMGLQAFLTVDANKSILHIGCLDARMEEIYYAGMMMQPSQALPHDQHANAPVHPLVIQPFIPEQLIPEQLIRPEQLDLALLNKLAPDGYTLNGSGMALDTFPKEIIKEAYAVNDHILPDAKYMALLAANRLDASQGRLPEDAQPVYLRDEVTWQKLPQYQLGEASTTHSKPD